MLGRVPLGHGAVSVFGHPVGRGNADVGYLPQRRRFDPDLRIRAVDLVRLGLDGERWGISLPSPGKTIRVAEVVGLVGSAAYRDRPFGKFSDEGYTLILLLQDLGSSSRM